MRARGLTRFVWPGMILAGLALGAFVFAAWPEPTFRVIRLPYGEAMPKTPVADARPVAAKETAAPAAAQIAPLAVPESAPDPIALVEPDPVEEGRAQPFAGFGESAEELGAEPLPEGKGRAQAPAGEPPANDGPPADDEPPASDEPPAEEDPPVLGVVIELP